MSHTKLDKSVVLYMPQAMLTNPEGGFKCGACMMGLSDTNECTILQPADIDLEYGICGLFVPGKNMKSTEHPPMEIVPKKVAGYSEIGPTHCSVCKNYISKPNSWTCKVVSGSVDEYGCCNHYET